MKVLKGSCLCGETEFAVQDNFQYAGYCHCSRCRKASGGNGLAIGGIPRENFNVTQGMQNIKHYSRSESSTACFCSHCGSSLYSEKLETGLIHIRYSSLDDIPSLLPQAHIFVSSKADWYEITDELPQFQEFPQ
ncbi:MAG: GFA family protein [Pseudomonadota bacterium]